MRRKTAPAPDPAAQRPSAEEWSAWARENLPPEDAEVFAGVPRREPVAGDRVLCRTATDKWIEKIAVTGVVADWTVDFPLVYVTDDEDWLHVEKPIPWPLEDVKVLA